MAKTLKLEVPDEVYRPMVELAAKTGQTPEEWALARLTAAVPPAVDPANGLARLLRFAGSVDLGRPIGTDNDAIDADLAREYGDTHENGS